jgi:hypothetical protein
MTLKIGADLSGIGSYIGTVGGFIDAVEHPAFEGDFNEHLAHTIESHFMTESIAANIEGTANISHTFEWGGSQGETSSIPLFRLNYDPNHKSLSYQFLPSREFVPLPDPAKYGFSPSKLDGMRDHTFQLKAVVMETMSKVTVAPVGAKRLFIPSMKSPRGYYMTSNPVTLNPGGKAATGGFATWWKLWFDTRAEAIVKLEAEETEEWLVLTGKKYVRYAAGTKIGGKSVGGQFASGKGVSMAFINAQSRKVKAAVLKDAERHFDEEAWASTWDD